MTKQSTDYTLEFIFSLLRWLFVAASILIYVFYYHKNSADFTFFIILLAFGVLYMGVTQYAIAKAPFDSKFSFVMTRGGILFDYLAFIALLCLTGGTESPLYPISYLIILHASVYWGLRGGLMSAFLLLAAYGFILVLKDGGVTEPSIPYHAMNGLFLLMFGVLGGLIVDRERRHMNEKQQYLSMARSDYLTGLYNHRTFQEHLQERLRERKSLVLVMADIDSFKSVNDQFGHVVGDQVLKGIGVAFARAIPESIGSAYRYGGEEFAVLLDTGDRPEAMKVLEAFREQLARLTFQGGDRSFSVTMSFGAVVHDGQCASLLVQAADRALYEAKKSGRDQVVWEK